MTSKKYVLNNPKNALQENNTKSQNVVMKTLNN